MAGQVFQQFEVLTAAALNVISAQAGAAAPLDSPRLTGNPRYFDGASEAAIHLAFATIAQLQGFNATLLVPGVQVSAAVSGYHAAGDGGGGTFDLLPQGAITTADNIFVFAAAGISASWWVRRLAGVKICPEMAGCYGDTNPYVAHSGHDDTTAFQALINAMSPAASGLLFPQGSGGTIHLTPGKWYLIDSATLVVNSNIIIQGSAGTQNYLFVSQGVLSYAAGGIALNPSFSLGMKFYCRLSGFIIWNSGLEFEPASLSDMQTQVSAWQASGSKAITDSGQDNQFLVDNMVVIGFDYAVYTAAQSFNVNNLLFDCASGLYASATRAFSVGMHIFAKAFWSININGIGLAHATSVAPGTGYSVNDVLTVVGGTGTAAQITVNSVGSGGSIATYTVSNVGNYSQFIAATSNPVSVTGGTGAGATFNIYPFDASYRPGAAIELFSNSPNGNQAFSITHSMVRGHQIGYKVSGAYNLAFNDVGYECGTNWGRVTWDTNGASRGLWVQAGTGGPAPTLSVYDCYLSGADVNYQNDSSGPVRLVDGQIIFADSRGGINQLAIWGTAGSEGEVIGTYIGGSTSAQMDPMVVIDKGALNWTLVGLQLGNTTPRWWLQVDPSAMPFFTCVSTNVDATNSGARQFSFSKHNGRNWIQAHEGQPPPVPGPQAALTLNVLDTLPLAGTTTTAPYLSLGIGGSGSNVPTFAHSIANAIALYNYTGCYTTTTVTVNNGGTGYVNGDTIRIAGNIGLLVTSAIGGVIQSGGVSIQFGGFFSSPLVAANANAVTQYTTSGVGIGATFNTTQTLQAVSIVTASTPVAGGTGYTNGDLLTDITQAQYKATVSGGVITALVMQQAGMATANILPLTAIALTGGTGTGATATPTLSLINATYPNMNGNVMLGGLAIKGVTDTDNWPQMPYSKGAPTGTPATLGVGHCPFQYDTTNNKLWIWNKESAAWKGAVLS